MITAITATTETNQIIIINFLVNTIIITIVTSNNTKQTFLKISIIVISHLSFKITKFQGY